MTGASIEPIDLRVEAGGRVSRVAYTLTLIGTLVGLTLIAAIAAALSGLWRTVALAVLTPILVLSILALWRAARAVSEVSARRVRTLTGLRAGGVVGILATPELGAWEERVQRNLLLPAGPHLWYVGPATIDSEDGQRRMQALYSLLGQVRPAGATLPLPARATLVVLPDAEEAPDVVRMYDLGGCFMRADGGDEAALDALHDAELAVQQLAAEQAARPR